MNYRKFLSVAVCACLSVSWAFGDEASEKARTAGRDRGLKWLAQHQAADGSWGKRFSVAVTSLACLCQLANEDEPFEGAAGRKRSPATSD